MTLQGLIDRYFDLMRSGPTLEDLARFTCTVPFHLQLGFLGWLRSRADALESMGCGSRDGLLN
jgi:hypothetical protein